MSESIINHIWLWSHPAACYNGLWNLPGESAMSPVDAAAYMGIKNAVMVVFADKPKPPFDDYSKQFAEMDKVVWSIIGDGSSKRNDAESDLSHVIELKNKMDNLRGGIMDDFFGHGRESDFAKIKKFSDQLHSAGLELWVVLYGHQMETPELQKYLELCDVISFWTWRAEELPLLEERFGKVESDCAPTRKSHLAVICGTSVSVNP